MRILGMFVVGALSATSAAAQVATEDLQNRAVEWMQAYLRIDTIDPLAREFLHGSQQLRLRRG